MVTDAVLMILQLPINSLLGHSQITQG